MPAPPCPSVLITGGTGSLGRALIQRFLTLGVPRVCSYSHDEKRRDALADMFPQIHAFMGDVRDQERLEVALHGVDTVVHAAALKRVTKHTETDELIKTNTLGTMYVAQAAMKAGIRRVVFISSDKACLPENDYGCSKRAAERYCVGFNLYSVPRGMRVSAVRYGNVLGSNGSVVEIWRGQLARGERLTVTNPDMVRFWITMRQAVDLVLYAISCMRGGEVFVPVLPSMRVGDLARALAPEQGWETIGARPCGEKFSERLLSDEEAKRALRRDGYILIPPEYHEWTDVAWEGEKLPEGFVYDSATNDRWLTVEEMREMLAEVA